MKIIRCFFQIRPSIIRNDKTQSPFGNEKIRKSKNLRLYSLNWKNCSQLIIFSQTNIFSVCGLKKRYIKPPIKMNMILRATRDVFWVTEVFLLTIAFTYKTLDKTRTKKQWGGYE